MKSYKYIGIYNYLRDDLPITKMIGEMEDDIEEVIKTLKEHSEYRQTSFSQYHISEYYSDWENKQDPVEKIRTIQLSNYVY